MSRHQSHCGIAFCVVASSLVLGSLLAAGGCAPLLATGVYVFQGGNVVPAECDALRDHRVVVVCRPPSTHEYRHAGASRAISQRVSELLVQNVKGIDVVPPREVDNWIDGNDWDNFKDLATAVKADEVVYIELNDFELFKGKTLYQGRGDINVSVYDMKNRGKMVWDKSLGQILYPTSSAIPIQDKPVQQFEHEFVGVVADRIAENFYKHDPNADFALDAAANH